MVNYDLTCLTPGGVERVHYTAPGIETDGPWLHLTRATDRTLLKAVPSHAVVALDLCTDPDCSAVLGDG